MMPAEIGRRTFVTGSYSSHGMNSPKGIRIIAQGCPPQRATLGIESKWTSTLKGLRIKTEPFQGTTTLGTRTQGSPLVRATLGYVT